MGFMSITCKLFLSLGKYITIYSFVHIHTSINCVRLTSFYSHHIYFHCNDISIQPYFNFTRHHSLHFWTQLSNKFYFFYILKVDWYKTRKKIFIQIKNVKLKGVVTIIYIWRKFKIEYIVTIFNWSFEMCWCIYL